jgi:hypothetical protein
MVSFQTKNSNLGKFWRALGEDHLVHFVFLWYILCSFGTYCVPLVHIVFLWYIFPVWVSRAKKKLATLNLTGKKFWRHIFKTRSPTTTSDGFFSEMFYRKKITSSTEKVECWQGPIQGSIGTLVLKNSGDVTSKYIFWNCIWRSVALSSILRF